MLYVFHRHVLCHRWWSNAWRFDHLRRVVTEEHRGVDQQEEGHRRHDGHKALVYSPLLNRHYALYKYRLKVNTTEAQFEGISTCWLSLVADGYIVHNTQHAVSGLAQVG